VLRKKVVLRAVLELLQLPAVLAASPAALQGLVVGLLRGVVLPEQVLAGAGARAASHSTEGLPHAS
jgi:hypothetical protein